MPYVALRENYSKVLAIANFVLQEHLISKSCTILSIGSEGSAEQLLLATSVCQFPEQLMKAIFDMHKTVSEVLQGLAFSKPALFD